MKIKVFLEEGDNCCEEEASEVLYKALSRKEKPQKKKHPDRVVEELTQKFIKEYEKHSIDMMKDILEEIKK